MHDPFAQFDAETAEGFLESFDPVTRGRGETYFRQGRVSLLEPEDGQPIFLATVQGSQLYQVTVCYDEDDGWLGTCTCPVEFDCKHVYAAMKAVLAERSIAAVRGLSAGATPKPGGAGKATVRPKAQPGPPPAP
ncbi:MAG: SWIM zinc finger family protein, partial [Verrucomicrobia bacterium]|nr:SWIM zinc finger family protein [Verrucomicrobiota bacterium]